MLRDYQIAACNAVRRELAKDEVRATLVQMATGLGKTQVFCEIAKNWDGRVLVLAHRAELVDQARRRLQSMTGEWVGIEAGLSHSHGTERLVVGSVDSVKQRRKNEGDGTWAFPRMERMGNFSLIIVDEAHHYVAETYRRPLDYWKGAKVLGVSATPNRKDGKAMGMIFDSQAYCMDIMAGINEGYLVPGKGRSVHLDDLDISDVNTVAGDLNQGQLDEATLRACEGICQHVIQHEPKRQGLLFFPGVNSAHYAAERLNHLNPGSAVCIDGKTERRERQRLVDAYKKGETQYLCNCQIATEGFDHPPAAFVVPRLTKSGVLYTQQVGRVTRVLPGVVDGASNKADIRRHLIRQSDKPSFTIIDFVGNHGRHDLLSSADALGGNYSEEVVAKAKKRKHASDGEFDITASLEAAKHELQRMAAEKRARIAAQHRKFNPFERMGIDKEEAIDHRSYRFNGYHPATPAQRARLEKAGINTAQMSKGEASTLIGEITERQQSGMCTYPMLKCLQDFGVEGPDVPFGVAREAMAYLSSRAYDRSKIDFVHLNNIIKGANHG